MPWSGSGTFSLDPAYSPEATGTIIDAARYNGLTSDIADGVSNAIAKDGQNTPTTDLPMGGHVHTGLGEATAAGESVRWELVDPLGSNSIASAATCSIFGLAYRRATITGTTTITSFGANTLGQLRWCKAGGAFTITHSANLVCPGAVNISAVAGDFFLVMGLGSSACEIVQYQRGASLASLISDLGPAAAANSIANGVYKQTWDWTGAFSSGESGLKLTGTSSNSFGTLLQVVADVPKLASFSSGSSLVTGASLDIYASGALTYSGGTRTDTGATTDISITAQSAKSGEAQDGGDITITTGAAGGGGSSKAGVLTLASANKLVIKTQHVYLDDANGTPTNAPGYSGTIVGTDHAFQITTSVQQIAHGITFADPWATAPAVVSISIPSVGAGIQFDYFTYTVSTTGLTIVAQPSGTAIFPAGTIFNVICYGVQ